MARRGSIACVGAALLLAAGCGSASKPPPGLTAPQRAGLLTRITKIRDSAAAGDRALTEQRLRGFRRAVDKLLAENALDPATARALIVGVTRALARVPVDVQPPAPLPTPAPAPQPPGQAKKHAEHKKKDHGKGNGEGD